MTPDAISHYRIISKLGAGGMGEVYLAEDRRLGRKVALKMFNSSFIKSEDRLRRFELEARTASSLNHPNILTIHEVGEQDDSHYIVMEYVEGETLRKRLLRSKMPSDEILDKAIQIASAIAAAHQAGIVHRDIKPENIMIRPDGYVKVLDFGLAKLTERRTDGSDTQAMTIDLNTEPGTVMGTVKYMSPEQARGLAVDARSDIFSFGVVLYEMIAGHPPFEGLTTTDILVAILERQPPPLASLLSNAPIELDPIVRKCLEKNREHRYQSAQEVVSDLKTLTSGRSNERLAARLSPSIAVLPFVNMSADAENEFFCDGLAEELLNALAKIDELRVAARTSAFSFKGKEADIRDIGNKLNVSAVLEGSVRKSGNRLRVTAQLVNVADGYHLWSERYDRQMEDIFEIQDEISLAIVDALKVRLLGDQQAAVLRRPTENTQAYELYLKGRYYYFKWTEEGFKKAIEYYQQAISLDPAYAAAYAELANTYGTLVYFGHLPPNETLPLVTSAIEKALELDDNVMEAHLTLGKIKFYYKWDFAGAEREFRRALDLNPNYAEARLFYAFYMASCGRFEDAVIEANRAIEMDPLSLTVSMLTGFCFFLTGRFELAQEQARKMIEIEPNFHGAYWLSGIICMLTGRFEDAIEPYKKAISLGAGFGLMAYLGFVYGASGKRPDAMAVIEKLDEIRQHRYVPAYNTAIVYAGLGDADEMFRWLEKAYEERSGPLAILNRDKTFIAYYDDPRFQDLLRRIGLS